MKCTYVSLLLFALFGFILSWQVKTRCPTVQLNNGKVRIRARGRILRFECYDGFILIGNRYSTCIRGLWDTPVPVCVSTQCVAPKTYPAPLLVATKLNGAVLLFFCPSNYNLIGSAEIYCEGRKWNGSIPYCRDTKQPVPTACDFERTDLCWWEQDPQHNFDWRRHNFATPSTHIGTGPTHDHTLGPGNDGHYLYIEASGQLVNDTARITSPLYISSQAESACFSFWYHMYGATMGTLNIYFKEEMNNTKRLMFTKSRDQGNQWFHGIFDLPKTNDNFQIIIEGVRGSTYVSDMAIDDVALLHGDECLISKNETINATSSDDDQIELVNAQQSCRGRCDYYTRDDFAATTIFVSSGPESCRCTLDCAERSLCCPDYAYYCVLEYATTVEVKTETTIPQLIYVHNDSVIHEGTSPPTRNFTLTGFPINPKDNIDLDTPKPSSTTTQKPLTRKLTTKTTLPPIKRTTKMQTQQTETKETPFAAMTLSTKYAELQDRPELHIVNQKPEKVRHNGGTETLLIAAIGTTVVVLSLLLVITIIVVKRRKSYKRGANGSALSEDSDVRYLTSDEILDFNLARPDNGSEEM